MELQLLVFFLAMALVSTVSRTLAEGLLGTGFVLTAMWWWYDSTRTKQKRSSEQAKQIDPSSFTFYHADLAKRAADIETRISDVAIIRDIKNNIESFLRGYHYLLNGHWPKDNFTELTDRRRILLNAIHQATFIRCETDVQQILEAIRQKTFAMMSLCARHLNIDRSLSTPPYPHDPASDSHLLH